MKTKGKSPSLGRERHSLSAQMHIQLARINNEVVTSALRLKYHMLMWFIWLMSFYFLETILYKTAYEFVHSNYFCRVIYIINMFSEFLFIMFFLYAPYLLTAQRRLPRARVAPLLHRLHRGAGAQPPRQPGRPPRRADRQRRDQRRVGLRGGERGLLRARAAPRHGRPQQLRELPVRRARPRRVLAARGGREYVLVRGAFF